MSRHYKVKAFDAIAEGIADMKPKDRAACMAAFTKALTKAQAEMVLNQHISTHEWYQAGMHEVKEGPMVQAEKKKFSRANYNVAKFEANVANIGENYFQHHAYGSKLYKTSTGAMLHMDKVSTTMDSTGILRNEAAAGEATAESVNIADEDRCTKSDPKSLKRCRLPKDHNSRCSFTHRGDALSASSLERILSRLTAGATKSLQGLDDEKVIKGTNNIKRLHEIKDLLASSLGLPEQEIKDMGKHIDECGTFHKTDFAKHLSEHGQRSCQCISCGLSAVEAESTSEKNTSKKTTKKKTCYDVDVLPCPLRGEGKHCGPCKHCEDAFQIFCDLNVWNERAKANHNLGGAEAEKYVELGNEILRCRKNLIDLRSHIARIKVEYNYYRRSLHKLGSKEGTKSAIVVSDYKMKINPLYYRENQKKFFGKRGTSCLGFLVLSNADGKEQMVDHTYILLFSDDTTQDASFVASGKAFVYNEILPALFPSDVGTINVQFESDGAGCFNSSALIACQSLWYSWTDGKVEEVECRTSVNGDGKTTLDGFFGKAGRDLRKAVDNGAPDVTNAATCVQALATRPNNTGDLVNFLPDRGQQTFENSTKALTHYYQIKLDRDANCLICKRHSGFGDGITIDLAKIDNGWTNGSLPPTPMYTIMERNKSTTTSENSTETAESRLKKKQTTKLLAHAEGRREGLSAANSNAIKKGLYKCQVLDKNGHDCCTFECKRQTGLDNHMRSGNHSFPSRNMTDAAAMMLSGSDGILRLGNLPNRSDEYGNMNVVDGSGAGVSLGAEWYERGWGLKPARATPIRMSEELAKTLTNMFEEGENDGGNKIGRQKWTAVEARQKLKEERLASGLLKYSSTSDYGKLPSIEQIKSFWSRYKIKKSKAGLEGVADNEIQQWVNEALLSNGVTSLDKVDELNPEPNSVRIPEPGVDGAVQNRLILDKRKFVITGAFPMILGGGEGDSAGVEKATQMIEVS